MLTYAVSVVSLTASVNSVNSVNNNFRTPGWSEYVEPLRQKSLFWHAMWKDCGHPRSGAVADCMRRARASYHYGIRRI